MKDLNSIVITGKAGGCCPLDDDDGKTTRCWLYKPKTENRCATCAKSKNGGRGTCVLEEGYGCDDYEKKVDKAAAWFVKGLMDGSIERTSDETEKHYRPFRDTDELIKEWNKKFYLDFKPSHDPLTMPLIWVRGKISKNKNTGWLVTGIGYDGVALGDTSLSWEELFEDWVFLDGTPCGVEE